MRLVVVLLFLVVLPTAILSLIAGRSIQARELLLYQRFEDDAAERMERVRTHFNELRSSDLDAVVREFRTSVLAGTDAGVMSEREVGLQKNCNFVKTVYLFMNPWNFIFPPAVAGGDAAENADADTKLLQQELTRRIAFSGHGNLISFRYAGRVYSFVEVPGYSSVYAGVSWNSQKVFEYIKKELDRESTGDIELRIVGVHGGFASEMVNTVQVSDSFNPRPSAVSHTAGVSEPGGVLIRAYMPEPFADVEIAAFLVGEQDIRAADALEGNLIRWGVFLLAVVITAGSGVIIFKTVGQAAAARRRSEFVVSMSHDLRTPVAAMRVLADSLCAGRVEDPQKRREFMCSIASECERLGDMIERILFFFRQERGAVSYKMEKLDTVALTRSVVHMAETRFQGNLKVHFKSDSDIMEVDGDVEALSKVLTNLLDNAVKYGGRFGGEEGAVEVEIQVKRRQWRGRQWVVIDVRDFGSGIARSEQRRIFRRFYRVDSENHRHVGGIGLGLSLCSDIVRAHRGKIMVDSELGKGTVFSVWLRT